MIRVIEVNEKEWSAAAPGFADYNYEQNYAFAEYAARRTGSKHVPVFVTEDENVIAAASVRLKKLPLLGFGVAYIPSGPLIGTAGRDRLRVVLKALTMYFRDQGRSTLRMRMPIQHTPDQQMSELDLAGLGLTKTSRNKQYRTVLVNLRPEVAELRKNLHSKMRYNLKHAENGGLQIEHGDSDDLVRRFIALYRQMREFKSFESDVDPEFLLNMTGKEFQLDAQVATFEGVDVAAHVTCLMPSCATYLLGATNAEGRRLQAGVLLNWQALVRAKERGIPCYDLGGVDAVENPQGYRFKTGLGGSETVAGGPFEVRPAGLAGLLIDSAERLYNLRRRKS